MRLPTTSLPVLLLAALPAAAQLPAPGGAHVRTDDQGCSALALQAPLGQRPGSAAKLGLDPAWTPLGPFGGDVSDVAAKPGEQNVVLAGIAPSSGLGGTLFRSTDAGASWTEVASLKGKSVYDLEFAADGTAWAGTIDGPWKSTNGGASWTPVPLGIGLNDQVLEIALDALLPSRLWVGVADALGSQPQVVLRSDTGGASWTNVTPPLGTPLGCTGLAVDPANSNRVFACFAGSFGGGAIWRSLNGGASWTNVSAGLPANPLNDVQISGPRVLVCGGQLFGSQLVGVYASTTDGASWTPLHDGTWPLLVIHDLELDPADANRIYAASAGAGVYRTLDGGVSWEFGFGGTSGLSVNAVAVAPAGTAPIYAGSSSVAVWKSSGGAFLPSSAGIGSLNTVSISANPLDADELAVAFQGLNDGGVYSSLDGGLTWHLEALPGTRYNTVAFAPDGRLYAISDGPSTIAPEGVYRRDPTAWVPIGPDQGAAFESELFALAFDAADPDLLFAAGADFGVAGFEPTIWRTPDGGGIWTKTYEGAEDNEQVLDVAPLATAGGLDFVAAFQDLGAAQTGGALRSSDGGFSWSPSSAGLAPGAQATSLAVDRLDALTVYLADNDFGAGGVYRSLDGGQSWSPHGAAGKTLRLESDPLKPQRFFAAHQEGAKVSLSEDGGLLYAPYDAGLAAAGLVNDLSLVRGTCERLLLATATGSFGRTATCELEGEATTISVALGGSQQLDLARGPAAAAALYWIFGSVSGTSPGITAFGVTMPLNFDFYFNFTLTHGSTGLIAGGTGALGAAGGAQALFSVPGSLVDPSLVGTTVNHAFATFTLVPFAVLSASNAAGVLLTP